ncbi:MAG TPA: DNA translocase FtsK [Bacteroidales bacterium]
MAEKKNKYKQNVLKEPVRKPEPGKEKKPKIKPIKTRKEREPIKFNPKIGIILGLVLVVFSLFSVVAFSAYLVNWFETAKAVLPENINANSFTDHTVIVSNFTGHFGRNLSDLLVLNGFGLGAYFIAFIVFSFGLNLLFKIKLFKPLIWVQIITLSLFWLPMLANKFFSNEPEIIFGGFIGFQLNNWVTAYLGSIGLILLLILVPVIFILLNVKMSFFERSENENELATANLGQNEPREDKYNTIEFSVEEDEKDFEKNSYKIEVDKSVEELTVEDIDKEEKKPEEQDVELTIEAPVEEKTSSSKVMPGQHFGVETAFDPTLDLPDFKMPHLGLLKDYDDGDIKVDKEELEINKNKIVETLNHYSIGITKIKATIGPTVTLYEIVPAPGIRISKIKNLEDDIALSLSAMGIRIIAPIPGKGTVGIEVPNRNPNIVSMKSIFASDKFQNNKFELPFGLGKTIANESFVADLAKMPHILMAGATGQGKSVGLNAIIASLLFSKHPAELKFILVDPKKVELNLFSRIERHYLAKLPDSEEAIITDTRKVVRTLNAMSIEMDNRYELLKDAQVRNIKEYNAKFIARKLSPLHGHRYLPYLVLVIDEFADLIMTAGKEIEGPITRLAQLARAIGIHLIIATQRPSVNIITGTIKANFPARIAFRVISKIDSRTILDSSGADQLVGRGDMLLSTGNDLIRLQCAFIDIDEVEEVTDFIGVQRAYPDAWHLPEFADEEADNKTDFDANERDELFEDAARIIVQTQQGSTSLLQRKLKLGYNRAGRIIDQLEAAGIVGPFEGSKAREVRVANEVALEQFLKDLNLDNNI